MPTLTRPITQTVTGDLYPPFGICDSDLGVPEPGHVSLAGRLELPARRS